MSGIPWPVSAVMNERDWYLLALLKELFMPNQTAGQLQVEEGDWDYLNFILRDVQGRIDAQGGNSGDFTHQDNIDLGDNRVVSVADPVDDQDAVTKLYLETNFAAKPSTDTTTTDTELNKVANTVVNVGRGLSETSLDIGNDPINGTILGANNAVRGGFLWSNPHEIHTIVSGVF